VEERLHGVEGSRLCCEVEAASANSWQRPGQRCCTDMVTLHAHSHRDRDIDTGATFTLRRRDNRDKRRP
jgi:hypothetical protein